jgi:hypothetical protein
MGELANDPAASAWPVSRENVRRCGKSCSGHATIALVEPMAETQSTGSTPM